MASTIVVPPADRDKWENVDPRVRGMAQAAVADIEAIQADVTALQGGSGILASEINITDADSQITGTTVETALVEMAERVVAASASETTIKAIPAAARADGSLVVDLTNDRLWVFDSGSSASASALVLVPDAGSGRWVRKADVTVVSKSFGFADLQEADMSIDVAFAAAIPAGAIVLGGGFNVTAAFDNVGDTANVTADLGVQGGDVDGFCDGASLDAVAKSSGVSGALIGGLVGAITPSIRVLPDVNGNTLTKGAAVAYLAYIEAF